eukprot:1110003-Prorocentrum_minimum.AAC.5
MSKTSRCDLCSKLTNTPTSSGRTTKSPLQGLVVNRRTLKNDMNKVYLFTLNNPCPLGAEGHQHAIHRAQKLYMEVFIYTFLSLPSPRTCVQCITSW